MTRISFSGSDFFSADVSSTRPRSGKISSLIDKFVGEARMRRNKDSMMMKKPVLRKSGLPKTKSGSSGSSPSYPTFAERLALMREQQKKEKEAMRRKERDEYLSLLKEDGELPEDENIRFE